MDGEGLFVVFSEDFDGLSLGVSQAYMGIAVILGIKQRIVPNFPAEGSELGLPQHNRRPEAEKRRRNVVRPLDGDDLLEKPLYFFPLSRFGVEANDHLGLFGFESPEADGGHAQSRGIHELPPGHCLDPLEDLPSTFHRCIFSEEAAPLKT
jgi:hypothetical protein